MDTHLERRKSISEEKTGTYFEKRPVGNCTSRAEQFENSPKLCGVAP